LFTEVLIGVLQDRPPLARRNAAAALLKSAERESWRVYREVASNGFGTSKEEKLSEGCYWLVWKYTNGKVRPIEETALPRITAVLLERASADEDESVRITSLESLLGITGSRRFPDLVISQFVDNNGGAGVVGLCKFLIKTYENNRDRRRNRPEDRLGYAFSDPFLTMAFPVLQRCPPIETQKLLLSLMDNEDPTLRWFAVNSVLEIGTSTMIVPLRKHLSDIAEIRKITADALAKLGDAKWRQWVKGRYEDFRQLVESGEAVAFDVIHRAIELHLRNRGYFRPPDILSSLKDAASLLAQRGDARIVGDLIRLAQADNDVVKSFVGHLKRLLQESASSVSLQDLNSAATLRDLVYCDVPGIADIAEPVWERADCASVRSLAQREIDRRSCAKA
jgi:hypothetical protein